MRHTDHQIRSFSLVILLAGWVVLTGCHTTQSGVSLSQYTSSSSSSVAGVLIDAGHGGEPSEAARSANENYAKLKWSQRHGYLEECYGSISADGYKEKDATLAVAKQLEQELKKAGIPTAMIRDRDVYVPLKDRVAISMEPKYRGWVMVSIHFNRSSPQQKAVNLSASYRKARGYEIYVLPGSGKRSTAGSRAPSGFLTVNRTLDANRDLAQAVSRNLDRIAGMRSRGIKSAWFVVLRGSPLPSILVEGGFLSNPEESRLIATAAYQQKLSKAIFDGIQDFGSRGSSYAQRKGRASGSNYSMASLNSD